MVPAGIPAPHWPAPVPGLAQVSVPPGTTFQPWLFSILTAVGTLNGYGFFTAFAGVYGLVGMDGTGP